MAAILLVSGTSRILKQSLSSRELTHEAICQLSSLTPNWLRGGASFPFTHSDGCNDPKVIPSFSSNEQGNVMVT